MPEYLAPGVFTEQVSFRAKSIEGVSTSTTAFIGPTRKGPLSGTPEVITNPGEFDRIYGGLGNLSFGSTSFTNYMAHAVQAYFNNGGRRLYVARVFIAQEADDGIASVNVTPDGTTQFVARHPGAGYNGSITAYEKRKLVTNDTKDNAPSGSLLCVTVGDSTSITQPAIKTGGTPPFNVFEDGSTLTFVVDGGAGETITFNGGNAEVTSDVLADTSPDTTGLSLTVSINGITQTITLPAGVIDAEDLVTFINGEIRHAYCQLVGGNQIVLGTDLRGTSATIDVTVNDVLGFAEGTSRTDSGSGNVADLENVTVAEIASLVDTAGITVSVAADADNNIVIATDNTGSTATLAFDDGADTSVMTALSLTEAQEDGVDGATRTYYLKTGSAWADSDSTLLAADPGGTLEIVLFNLEATDADGVSIIYEDLGYDANHPRYIGNILNETPTSRAEALENPYYYDEGTLTAFSLNSQLFGVTSTHTYTLAGGNDGIEPLATTSDNDSVSFEDGMELLESIDDVSIVAAPGYSALNSTTFGTVQSQLISHCERMKYRYAVLDTPVNQTVNGARTVRAGMDSTYAALYYPWVRVANPLWRPGQDQIEREINLPPSGFVTGIYARNDINRGVWKAPANEIVRGALRFERDITTGQQEVLNPEGVNCLRYFFGRGYRVWGARSATSDPEYKYVNLQRYMIYLQHSIYDSTQWAVFEPNGPRLWANITDTVTSFLFNEWRNGALLGVTPKEAFQVRCGRETMTQADLDNGRLICEVGVALLRPAEFVIFRVGQKTADAQ